MQREDIKILILIYTATVFQKGEYLREKNAYIREYFPVFEHWTRVIYIRLKRDWIFKRLGIFLLDFHK
jgi:hypothetical protein